jgi:glucose/arabinose dehydrogenase
MKARAALASLICLVLVAAVGPAAQGTAGRGELLRAPSRGANPSLPSGFTDTVAIGGLDEPSVVQFAPDGRVFVAEKSGVVVEFDSLSDPTATIVADLSTNVYDWADRGLLGMALDPNFLTNPYLYVLYTLDAPIGQQPPVYHDDCGADYCVAGARLSRILVDANNQGGPEQVLLEGWCQQYSSHSIGTLAFGPEGALYVGGGDGASFDTVDYGQFANPCVDPNREGGALRSQDVVHEVDPTGFNGAILRVDPATGDPWPGNPLSGNADPTDDRIIAYGMRNPFRFAVRSGTDRIWLGTWAGTRGRRSTPSARRGTPRWRTSAGRASRASARSRTTRPRTSHLQPALRRTRTRSPSRT